MTSPTALALVTTLAIGSVAAHAADTPSADTPSRVYAAYGLTGTWSPACDQPAGPRNPRFTYQTRPDGLVDTVGDFGEDGPMRSTTRDAVIDDEHRLHVSTETKFDNQLQSFREAMVRAGKPSDVTSRTILVMGDDRSLTTQDVIMTMVADSDTRHIVAEGYALNPATQAPGPKLPVRFKCSD